MFEEDEQGDLLLVPGPTKSGVKTISGAAAARILATTISDVLSLAEPTAVPKTVGVKTLREMLYEQEPWRHAYGSDDTHLSPAIRRLIERRINRVLDTVANWMLGVVEERIGDEMTLVVLLELAEAVRQQIEWPERDANEAIVEAEWPKRDDGKAMAELIAMSPELRP